MQDWFYAVDGEQRGPVDSAALKTLFAQGHIDASSLVWSAGMSDWLPLSTRFGALGIRPPTSSYSAPPLKAPTAATSPSPQSSSRSESASPSPYAPPSAAPPASTGPFGGQVEGPVVQAGFLRRWAALIVDSVILGIALITVLVLIALPFGLFTSGAADTTEGIVQVIYYLLYIIVAPIYYAGMESSEAQATLGKRLIGIKVVDTQGRRLSFMHALARWVAAITGYITLYIGFLLAAFTEKKQALHDMIASTYVVDKWAYTEFPERQRTGSAGCLVIGLVLILPLIALLGILAAIAIPAYQDYSSRAKTSGVISQMSSSKVAVAEYLESYDRCPESSDELGIPSPVIAEGATVSFSEAGGRECEITLVLAPGAIVRGSVSGEIRLTLSDSRAWSCTSDLPISYLPASCR